mmetsp:Transcript_38123/g.79265  ORF Transcript_38123/g.79265 Transcript_38123/m.79265 type:complete len:206 (-) Transcript_38123:1439-2056(-)
MTITNQPSLFLVNAALGQNFFEKWQILLLVGGVLFQPPHILSAILPYTIEAATTLTVISSKSNEMFAGLESTTSTAEAASASPTITSAATSTATTAAHVSTSSSAAHVPTTTAATSTAIASSATSSTPKPRTDHCLEFCRNFLFCFSQNFHQFGSRFPIILGKEGVCLSFGTGPTSSSNTVDIVLNGIHASRHIIVDHNANIFDI